MSYFYVRRDENDPWFGPIGHKVADRQARIMTIKGTPSNVLYAQVGVPVGSRPGDPVGTPQRMQVIYQYVNGKRILAGRMASFNSSKMPLGY